VIVHIADFAMLDRLVTEVPEAARKLMHAFWPGPLTLLLPRTSAVPDAVTAGRPLVGVRMPAHPVALGVIRMAGVPVAAPSANSFGHISPTTADHVLEDLDGRIDAVLDAGPTIHGVESTVLDPCQNPMVIYRPGAVTAAQIRDIAGAWRPLRASWQPPGLWSQDCRRPEWAAPLRAQRTVGSGRCSAGGFGGGVGSRSAVLSRRAHRDHAARRGAS
jgi:L-threonylcarbamoyladenylate synthase